MGINIVKKTSTHNTTACYGRAKKYIVIHYTAGVTSKAGSAASTASYFSTSSREASADFIVDDATIVQYNPDINNRYCWHCGGKKTNNKGGSFYGLAKNSNSIGIEICSTNSSGRVTNANDRYWSYTDSAINNAIELTKYLMETYNIDASHVIRHYDVTGKLCPGIVGWNADSGSDAKWVEFKSKLNESAPIKCVNYQATVTATDGLNCRTSPVNGSVITTYQYGTLLNITKEQGNWGYTGLGWVSLIYTEKSSCTTITEEDEDMTLDTFKKLMNEYRTELRDNDCGDWSKDAREWAISTGMFAGGNPLPDGTPNYMWSDMLTREQAAQLFYNFAKKNGMA